MKLHVNREKAETFNTKVDELFSQTETDLLGDVFVAGAKIVKEITYYYRDLHFDENLARDAILECLQRMVMEEETPTAAQLLQSIVHNKISTLIEDADIIALESPDLRSYSFDVESRFIFEETLQNVLLFLPLHVKSAILYLIEYRGNDSLFRALYSPLDYFLILQGIDRLSQQLNIGQEKQKYLTFELPESQTGRLLFVSSLYKLSPAVLVLLIHTKKLECVLQMCKLFGGQTVSIPTLAEFSFTLTRASDIAQKVENGVRVGDQESLAYLATELEEIKTVDYSKLSLNPLLSSFIEDSLAVTLMNYEALQKRLISTMDTTDPKDIERVYDFINKEIDTQAYLLLQLTTSSVEEYPDIQRLLNQLKIEPKKQPHV